MADGRADALELVAVLGKSETRLDINRDRIIYDDSICEISRSRKFSCTV